MEASPPQDVGSVADTVLPPPLQLGAGEPRGLQVVQHCGVFALLPQLIAVWLQAAHKHVHGDLHHVFAAGTLKDAQGSWRLSARRVRVVSRRVGWKETVFLNAIFDVVTIFSSWYFLVYVQEMALRLCRVKENVKKYTE